MHKQVLTRKHLILESLSAFSLETNCYLTLLVDSHNGFNPVSRRLPLYAGQMCKSVADVVY